MNLPQGQKYVIQSLLDDGGTLLPLVKLEPVEEDRYPSYRVMTSTGDVAEINSWGDLTWLKSKRTKRTKI